VAPVIGHTVQTVLMDAVHLLKMYYTVVSVTGRSADWCGG